MAVAYKVASGHTSMSYNGAGGLHPARQKENPWEPYRLKLFPKVINEHRYWPGDTVYRRWRLSPSGGYWQYGDEFDYLKWMS